MDDVSKHLQQHIEVIKAVSDSLGDEISKVGDMLVSCFVQGNKVLLMGNGGSAADAQHFAAELVGRFKQDRKALPAISLTTDTSILTAVSNDFDFDEVFKRQLEALAQSGDLVIVISTSGNSNNLIKAVEAAHAIGCSTFGLLGRNGGRLAAMVNRKLIIPSYDTPRIQEAHLLIIHILCDLVEKKMFSN